MSDSVFIAFLGLAGVAITSILGIFSIWFKYRLNNKHNKIETSLSIYIKGNVLIFKDAINLPKQHRFDLYIIRIMNKIRNNHTDKKHLILDFTDVTEFNDRFRDQLLLIVEDGRKFNNIGLTIKLPNIPIFSDLAALIDTKQLEMSSKNFDKNVIVSMVNNTSIISMLDSLKTITTNINLNFNNEDIMVIIDIDGEFRYRFEQYNNLKTIIINIVKSMFNLSGRQKILTINTSGVSYWDSSSNSTIMSFIEEASKYRNIIIHLILNDKVAKYDKLKEDIEESVDANTTKGEDTQIFLYTAEEYKHRLEELELEEEFKDKTIATGTP